MEAVAEGLHLRNPPDVFATNAARSTYFTTTDTTAYLQFVQDRTLVIIVGTLASATYWTYVGDTTAYDDAQWANRTDAVRGIQGVMGNQGVWYARIFQNSATVPTAAPTGGSVADTGIVTAPTGWFIASAIPVPATGEETYEAIGIVNPATDTFPLVPTWSHPFEVGGVGGAAAAAAAAASATAAAASATTASDDATEAADDANRAEAAARTAVDIPTGSPRGALVATSPTLSVTTTTNATVRAFGTAEEWAVESDAPAGFAATTGANNERLVFPDLHPPGMNGVFYVVEVGGVEIDEALMPWGGVSQSPSNANSVQYLSAVSSGVANNLTLRYFARSGDTPAYAAIYGAATVLPANTVLKIYAAVVRGEKGDPGTGGGGGGLSTVATDATLDGDGSSSDPLTVATPFTTDEKTKLGSLELTYNLGNTPTQTGATFAYASPVGYTLGGWPAGGAIVYLGIGTVDSPGEANVIIQVSTDTYELKGIGDRTLQLHELIDDTQYVAIGQGAVLTLIGTEADVVDISESSLPTADIDAAGHVYLDRFQPGMWILQEDAVTPTPAQGDLNAYVNALYVGAFNNNAASGIAGVLDIGKFYWNQHSHAFLEWYEYTNDLGTFLAFRTIHNPGVFLGGANGIWIGYRTTGDLLRERLPDPIDLNSRYIGVRTTGADLPVELDNATWVAPVDRHSVFNFATLGIAGTSTGQTAAQVQAAIAAAINALIDGAPVDRNTLNELNDAIVALAGMSGSSGATFRFGSGAPADTLGADGDSYLDVDSGMFYWRASGAYASEYTDQAGPGGNSTADILIDELGTNATTITLTTNLFWVGTGITVPLSVHGVLIDLSPATDDYHFVDWDTIRAKTAGVIGEVSDITQYETFVAQTTTGVGHLVRIGHDDNGQILLADDSGTGINIDFLRVERILVPILSGFSLRSGSAIPQDSLGVDEDWYIRITTGEIYHKVSGSWTQRLFPQNIYAALSGTTFTGAVSGIPPTLDSHFVRKDYVDNLVNPVQTHTNYIAISEDITFTEAEYLAGNTSMSGSLVVPTYSGVQRYIAIAVPDNEGDITNVTQNGVSIFGAWERITGVLSISSEDHKAWRTTVSQNDLASGITYVIAQA